MTTAEIIALVSAAVTLVGIIVSYLVTIDKVMDGQRCLLRSEMLRIYYHNRGRGDHIESVIATEEEYQNSDISNSVSITKS